MPFEEFLVGGGAVALVTAVGHAVKARLDARRSDRESALAEEKQSFDFNQRVLEIQNALFQDFDKRIAFIREERDELQAELRLARQEIAELRKERELLQRDLVDMRSMVTSMQGQIEGLTLQLTVALTAQERAESAMLELARQKGELTHDPHR